MPAGAASGAGPGAADRRPRARRTAWARSSAASAEHVDGIAARLFVTEPGCLRASSPSGSIGNPHKTSGHVHAQRYRRHAGGLLVRRCIAPPDAGATGLHLASCPASQRPRTIVRRRPACTHRRTDMILSNYDFAFCGFPSRAGVASRVDAAHDPTPKAAPVASFGVMRRRNGRGGGGRAAPVLAEQDKCRCRICASVCRNSSAHGSFFWQPLRHALMV